MDRQGVSPRKLSVRLVASPPDTSQVYLARGGDGRSLLVLVLMLVF